MRVSFFIPEHYLPNEARREAWKSGEGLVLEGSGKVATAQSWVYQTWQALDRDGSAVRLVTSLPAEGIVVALNGTLHENYKTPPGLFLIGIVADGSPHPAADLQIVQNSAPRRVLPGVRFLPHWPQPNLRARHPSRGDRFESVCFYGDPRNLAPELTTPMFRERVSALGLQFQCLDAPHWHDYTHTDCALAIRSLGHERHRNKPATKLYNAWLAGVPFLGGSDSAYASDGHPGVNYLRCTSIKEILAALQRLRDDAGLRARIVEAGWRAGRNFAPAATVRRWTVLLDEATLLHQRKVAASAFHCKFARFFRRLRFAWDGWQS